MANFHLRFKLLREERGWTQDEIADKLGVSRPTIAGYESVEKKRVPREETLNKIADIFGESIDYILGRSDIRASMHSIQQAADSEIYIAYLGGPPKELDEEEAHYLEKELEEFRKFKARRKKEREEENKKL